MKQKLVALLFIVINASATGCASKIAPVTNVPTIDVSSPAPAGTETPLTAAETSTPIVVPSPAISPTPYPTLPVELQNRLYEMLRTNGNCEFPCFLGIMPGKTPLDEAIAFFEIYDGSHEMMPLQLNFDAPLHWYASLDFGTRQGDFDISLHPNLQTDGKVVTGLIIDIQPIMRITDRKSDRTTRFLERYGIIELFKHHGVPDEMYLFPTRIRNTGSAYDIEVVYQDDKIFAVYNGVAKLADNEKYELCPAIGDGDIDTFSMAFADPENKGLNMIDFMWGSFNPDFHFSLDVYTGEMNMKMLDAQAIYDLFIRQEKRCFYEDEYHVDTLK
jgi:hypothetical protein